LGVLLFVKSLRLSWCFWRGCICWVPNLLVNVVPWIFLVILGVDLQFESGGTRG
jgi:hypothetical protein